MNIESFIIGILYSEAYRAGNMACGKGNTGLAKNMFAAEASLSRWLVSNGVRVDRPDFWTKFWSQFQPLRNFLTSSPKRLEWYSGSNEPQRRETRT